MPRWYVAPTATIVGTVDVAIVSPLDGAGNVKTADQNIAPAIATSFGLTGLQVMGYNYNLNNAVVLPLVTDGDPGNGGIPNSQAYPMAGYNNQATSYFRFPLVADADNGGGNNQAIPIAGFRYSNNTYIHFPLYQAGDNVNPAVGQLIMGQDPNTDDIHPVNVDPNGTVSVHAVVTSNVSIVNNNVAANAAGAQLAADASTVSGLGGVIVAQLAFVDDFIGNRYTTVTTYTI